jgi:hypothetical protein
MEVSSQFHAPAAIIVENDPAVTYCMRLGGPQSRYGRCKEEKISSPCLESNSGSLACSYTDRALAVAQAVSRWLPTAAARVRVRAEHMGFVVDKVALGQVFSDYFGFP